MNDDYVISGVNEDLGRLQDEAQEYLDGIYEKGEIDHSTYMNLVDMMCEWTNDAYAIGANDYMMAMRETCE